MLGYYRYALIGMPRTAMPSMPSGYTVRALTPAEVELAEMDAPLAVRLDRMAQGMTCLAAFNGKGAFVGVTWIGTAPFVEDDVAVRFAVPTGSSWDTGLWIAPRYRLSRAFAALWSGTATWMAQHGVDRSISRIADYNLASLLSHQRMGAELLDHVVFVRIGPWQIALSARPRLIRIGRDAPARLDLAHFALR